MDIEGALFHNLPNSLVVKPINFFCSLFCRLFSLFPRRFHPFAGSENLVLSKNKKTSGLSSSRLQEVLTHAHKTQNNKTQHNVQKVHKPNSWPDPETLVACTPRSSTLWNCGALRATGDNERLWEESWLRRTGDPSTVLRTCPWDMRCPPLGTWCES